MGTLEERKAKNMTSRRVRAWIGRRGAVLLCITFGWTLPSPLPAEDVYSPGGWSTLHRGPGNRKLVEAVA